nr:uncharacterized mitochondrial protein AtMg00810-like [Tanacetum cinerariifolium]
MTENKAYLLEYQDFNGGPVAFESSKGQITGKGKISTENLDFDDVYFVKDLQHFNLFSVSQMCDKKNKVLFTDTKCLVLSHDFKFPDENQVLLRVPRQHNMYSFNLENIVPSRGIKREYNNARTPQQNGVTERNNKTLIKATKTMLADLFLHNTFWDEAVSTACYVLNRPVTLENKANKTASPKEANNSAGTQDNIDAGNSEMEVEQVQNTLYCHYGLLILQLSRAAKASSTNYVHTTSILVNTASTPVKTASLLRNASAARPSNSNLLPYANQNNYQIPSLKDIYEVLNDGIFTSASYNDEGVVADFINLESTINTQQVLILVDLPFGKKVIGTKWVYRIKKDERDPKFPKKVYKFVKALYGLHQAPRAWYATISTFLVESGYIKGIINKTLFIKKDQKDIMLVQVYVDDIIFGSTKKSWCDEFEALMKNRFQMSSMGKLTFFLRLQVKQRKDGIFISQDIYVVEILKKFDFLNVKTASTPTETKKPLVKDAKAIDVDVHLYRSMISSLMHLTAPRPDIMYAVCACSRFQATLKTSHLYAMKKIFRYLKGHLKLGIMYPKESAFNLKAYSDSDYAGANLDRKSTTRGRLTDKIKVLNAEAEGVSAAGETHSTATLTVSTEAKMGVRKFFKCWFHHHTTNGHQFTMSNRKQELACPKVNGSYGFILYAFGIILNRRKSTIGIISINRNHVNNQRNDKNRDDNIVNDNIQGDARNVIVNNSRGCGSYKEFLACNPKDFDGKGGTIAYTRWTEKIKSVHDMSGCRANQKVKYIYGLSPKIRRMVSVTKPTIIQSAILKARLLTNEAIRIGALKKNTEKRGNIRELNKDGSIKNDNKRSKTGRAFTTTSNPIKKEHTDHDKAACPRLIRAPEQGGNRPNQTLAIDGGQAGSESRPPMLNKENYVSWSSRLFRYAKSRPNGKLIHNYILNGPYVRKIIPELGDVNRKITVTETFHLQTDDELSDKELKQIEADDQAIQTILLGLTEDIYATVESCETAQEIWLRVQQMMKGSAIGIQEKKAKLFNEWERFTFNEWESIESYYHRFLKLMNDLKRNKHFPEKIASNLKFLNNLQAEWSRHVTIVHQSKDLHTADYT